jgi:bifunctional non-homologous end joining protein LigD
MARDRLQHYRQKRDFSRTPEPAGGRGGAPAARAKPLRYVIQKHVARALHYDFRLEHDGVLLSWAVPKGPSENPADKRLAVQVEDHPLDYGNFEGTIPEGEYGGGTVMLWDRGRWLADGDVDRSLRDGKLLFALDGERLKGLWALVRLRPRHNERGLRPHGGDRRKNWLLIKEKDEYVNTGKLVTERETTSVKTGRTMAEIASGNSRVWHSSRGASSNATKTTTKKRTAKKAGARKTTGRKTAAKKAATRKKTARRAAPARR